MSDADRSPDGADSSRGADAPDASSNADASAADSTDDVSTADASTDDATADDEFDPVQVFPEAESMDLRPGSDDCYKCSTCDTNCPVAEVDDEFPGPKFQGPEQWRLKRGDDSDVDPSIEKCSNCMRCDHACPSDVPLSQMHNTARGEYVDEQVPTLSRKYLRNKLLANYGRIGRVASKLPRLSNFVLGLSVTKWVNERFLGITSEREFPAFATETFREWWADRGGHAASRERALEARAARESAPADESRGATADDGTEEKRIAYFHGDYANYNTPEVGKATVRLFEHFGYEVRVPDQRCSGTPMFANGMLEDARSAAEVNVATLADLVEEGYDVICSCTSCSMALRQEYPELFDLEGTDAVATNTWDALEYLRVHEDLEGALAAASGTGDVGGTGEVGEGTTNARDDGEGATNDGDDGGSARETFGDAGRVGTGPSPPRDADFAYHAPCHARNQGLDGQTIELFDAIEGLEARDVGDSCSGISGTYGWKEANYETSMAIGAEMFEHIDRSGADAGLTECPTCAMQMEHGTDREVRHTLEVVAEVLVGPAD